MKSTRQWGEKMWSVSSCIVWYRHVKSHCKVAVSFDIFSLCNDVELAVRLTRCHAFPPEIWVFVPFISGTQNCTVCVFKTVESVESLKPTFAPAVHKTGFFGTNLKRKGQRWLSGVPLWSPWSSHIGIIWNHIEHICDSRVQLSTKRMDNDDLAKLQPGWGA